MFEKRFAKRMFSLKVVLLFSLLFSSSIFVNLNSRFVPEVQAESGLFIGDYIHFGTYNEEPIKWRVVEFEGGNPILLSDRILSFKAFDSNNSSYYQDSTIRQWLNSTSLNSGSDLIDWKHSDPDSDSIFQGHNPYHLESGFMSDDNFTSYERGFIKPYYHDVVVSETDKNFSDGGSTPHLYETEISDVIQNYDSGAYWAEAVDDVFLLSVKQLKQWVYDNANILGNDYYIAKPTEQAVLKNTNKTTGITADTFGFYWLNTARSGFVSHARVVNKDGVIGSREAYVGGLGIRPALMLDLDVADFKEVGDGSAADPYQVRRSVDDTDEDMQAPTTPKNVRVVTNGKGVLQITWDPSMDNDAVEGYEVIVDGKWYVDTEDNSYSFVDELNTLEQYKIEISAFDFAGNLSNYSTPIYVALVDDTPPSAPTNVQLAQATETTLDFTWTQSVDDVSVAGYKIYANGSLVADHKSTTPRYQLTGLKSGSPYQIAIRAYDQSANVSKASSIKTLRTTDVTAPTVPAGLKAVSLNASTVRLTWSPSKDNTQVAGYHVYLNGKIVNTRTAQKVPNSAQLHRYDFVKLPSGIHKLQVQAFDSAGNTSKLSTVVTTPKTISLANKKLSVNGKTIDLGAGVTVSIIAGNAAVPFKPYLESLGFTVTYNAASGKIEAVNSTKTYYISMSRNSKFATIKNNGKTTYEQMPIAPTTQKNRLLIPVKFFADKLGYTVYAQ
jgi:hypothetical protein